MAELITQAEFSRRLGVTPAAVHHAIQNGRLELHASGKIDYTTQVINWYQHRDASKVRDNSGVEEPMAPSLNKAKLAKETFTAKLRQLEYERESGKLVDRTDVKTAMFKFCRVVREAVLNIPDRVAAEASAKMISYLKPILRKKLGKEMADQVIAELDGDQVERIVHEVWERESRSVLESIDEGPKLT